MNVEQILAKLVSFPVLGGESNLEIIHWIRDYIESFGITVNLQPNDAGDKASLHCRIGPEVDGGLILSAHTDVVPVEGQEWDTDPFNLVDKNDGNLYGRGACDMKGFIATCLAILPEILNAKLTKPVYFAFSYDEEIGCLASPLLVKHIRSSYKETPKYALIGEPSLLEPIVGQKGIYILETYVNGSAGHSSRIKQEVSAIHEAARLVLWLENKMNTLINGHEIDTRFDPPHTSLHVGQIHGGIAPNVIADKAYFYWDIRTIPKDCMETIYNEFEAHCREREQQLMEVFPDFEIRTIENHPPVPHLDTDKDEDIVGLIQKITESKSLKTAAYASEAGHFANGGFQSVICGPGSIAQAHRGNEYISKIQLQKGISMLRNLISEMSRKEFN